MKTDQPFGWDVTVEYIQRFENVRELYHFRGCSEAAAKSKARRKAIFKPHARDVRVVSAHPLTEQHWIGAYGLGRL